MPKTRLHFLDGLRGWAALAVLLQHLIQNWLLPLVGSASLINFSWYTPIGLTMDGTYAVYVFFVLSGLVLSYPTLISSRRYKTLSGMALTRYTRLTIPILAATLLAQAFWSAGMMHNQVVGALHHSTWLTSFYNFTPRPGEMWRFGFYGVYFDYDGDRTWNGAMWTMAGEFHGSFLVFLLLVLPTKWLRIPAALYALYLYPTQLYAGMFIGYLLAEATVWLGWLETASRRRSLSGLACIAVAVAIGTEYHVWGAQLGRDANLLMLQSSVSLLVLGVLLNPIARALLETRASQFMAGISFPLYLVQMPVICGVGCGLYLMLAPYAADRCMIFLVGIPTIITAIGTAIAFRALVEERAVIWAKDALLWLRDRLWLLLVRLPGYGLRTRWPAGWAGRAGIRPTVAAGSAERELATD